MKQTIRLKTQAGFTLTEMLVSILILLPIMGAAVSLFSVGAKQHASEQSSIAVNQDARAAFDMMIAEIAQAGSHRDAATTLTAQVNGGTNPASVAATTGFTVGDYVVIDGGTGTAETVQITAIGTNTITANFGALHANGASLRLFAVPYLAGMIPPAGLGANSSATATTLRMFGNITNDPTPQYIEYSYDSASAQITRSITPLTQATKSAAIPFITNIKANSVQFKLYTDSMGVVTAVSVGLTAQNPLKTGPKQEETELFSRVSIPAEVAASALDNEILVYGGPNRFPPTPTRVSTWASQ